MKLYTLGKTSGFWNLHTLCVCANIPRLIFPSSTAEKTVTEVGGGEKQGGNWGRHKYLFASPGNLCNSARICRVISRCPNDLYGQSRASHLSTVTQSHFL